MSFTYANMRNMYYLGIGILVLYALPKIEFVTKYVYPILEYELIPNMPMISLISIGVAFAAFLAYKYRRIG